MTHFRADQLRHFVASAGQQIALLDLEETGGRPDVRHLAAAQLVVGERKPDVVEQEIEQVVGRFRNVVHPGFPGCRHERVPVEGLFRRELGDSPLKFGGLP